MSTTSSHPSAAALLRAACRAGTFQDATAGQCAGRLQANLMIVPKAHAFDFLLFCQRNPKPCPLIEVVCDGAVEPACAPGSNLASDLPGYRVYRHGELVDEPSDVAGIWRDDLVSFLIGCSFSFESALQDSGVELRHVT
jgi:uncharacterized protein YcsI (UPF0317 family)